MYGLFEEKCAGGCCQTKNCLRPIGQVAQLGIVPQRLPAITWRESRPGDPGYAVLDINPLTGEQRYPYLRFADNSTSNRYQKKSCSRPNLLGYSTKTYLKTGERCSKRVYGRCKNRMEAQKQGDLEGKGRQSRLFTYATGYEIDSV